MAQTHVLEEGINPHTEDTTPRTHQALERLRLLETVVAVEEVEGHLGRLVAAANGKESLLLLLLLLVVVVVLPRSILLASDALVVQFCVLIVLWFGEWCRLAVLQGWFLFHGRESRGVEHYGWRG